ncbi:MAG: isocitrate/isopropylmalate family dehydrogenase, partial [Gammaproteobacteria bacterium]
MAYKHVEFPQQGQRLSIENGRLVIPDHPILAYVEGDGIGPDIMRACLRVWDAAIEQAYGGQRKVHWMELYMGEKAAEKYDGNVFPDEVKEALQQIIVSI